MNVYLLTEWRCSCFP